MSKKTWTVNFDEEQYVPGQTINGRLLVDLDQDYFCHSIVIKCKGKARVHWIFPGKAESDKTDETDKTVRYYLKSSKQVFFNSTCFALALPSGKPICLRKGQKELRFQFCLPKNIPSSFRSKHGEVKYTIGVSIEKKPFVYDCKQKFEFTVNAPFDLKNISGAYHEQTRTIRQNFGLLCFGPSPFIFTASLPKKFYFPGENIKVDLHATETPCLTMKTIKLELIEFLTYFPGRDGKRECSVINKESWSIEEIEEKGLVAELEIPKSYKPLNFDSCKLVKVEHALRVQVYSSDEHPSSKMRFDDLFEIHLPIRIGEVQNLIDSCGVTKKKQ